MDVRKNLAHEEFKQMVASSNQDNPGNELKIDMNQMELNDVQIDNAGNNDWDIDRRSSVLEDSQSFQEVATEGQSLTY